VAIDNYPEGAGRIWSPQHICKTGEPLRIGKKGRHVGGADGNSSAQAQGSYSCWRCRQLRGNVRRRWHGEP
jgi:hypothetical protein